ncbi:MAG: Uma2 family endonuclease [Desulfuromonadaceae bacterium]
MPQLKPKDNQRYYYSDYLTWNDGERWELIDGVAYSMSPAPGRRHQEISGELFRQLANYLKGKQCKVYDAPFDVRLSDQVDASDNYIETVVQPDILVVCDRTKLDEKGCNGAPDLIIEITSPSTAKHDLGTKFDLYQKHAIQEYWISGVAS